MKVIKQIFSLWIFLIFISLNLNSQNTVENDFHYQLLKAQYFKNLNPDSLYFHAKKAFLIAEENRNANHQIDALIVLIKSELKAGKLLVALQLCDSATLIANENNLKVRKNEILIYRGNAFQLMGFTSQALELFIEAQKQLEFSDSSEQMVDLFYYKALLFFDINKISECHKNLSLSSNVISEQNNPRDLFPIYMLYANSFNNQDSIYFYFQSAEYLIKNNPDMIFEKVVLLNNLAFINEELRNLDVSKLQYLEAIDISVNNGFDNYLSTLYNNYAYLLMAESKYDSAKYYLDQALDIAIDIKSLDMESEIYDSYSDYYEKTGDFENALAYTDLFIEKRDQYRQQQQIQKSLFLSVVFDTEQKEKQILEKKKQILEKENKINRQGFYIAGIIAVLAIAIGLLVYSRQKFSLTKSRMETMKKGKSLEIANAVILGQDDERKRLAMDLHDGLAARLSALIIMFDGFFNSHKKYEEVSNCITEIHKDVRDLSHRMAPPVLENLGLNKAIGNLVSSINMSDKFNVLYETNFDTRLPDKLEINIYFLIYELLNNATRHSKGNTIYIQLIEDKYTITLSVEDNGGGFTSDKSNEGMGLKNIRNRVDYLGGKFNIESNDSDTLFIIEIPNNKYDKTTNS